MFDEATETFLRSGCALIVGSVGADGQPHASRGWGVAAVDDERDELVVLVDDGDAVAHENLRAGRPVAVTATDVRTLRSLQLKGRVVATGRLEAGDDRIVRAYCDQFFDDIVDTDGTDREVLERMVPAAWFRCRATVADRFDQTPGPKAGQAIGAAR